jgi:hypothetical protein
LEAIIGDRLKAADVALNSGGEAAIIRSETQDGCCVARAPWTERLAHLGLPFLKQKPPVEASLIHMVPLSSQENRDKFVQCKMTGDPGPNTRDHLCCGSGLSPSQRGLFRVGRALACRPARHGKASQ